MDGLSWNEERFVTDLATELVALLGNNDITALGSAVARCGEAAEAICRDRMAECGPGCPHCCVLNVAALLPEAVVIAAWLKQHLDGEELVRLDKRLAGHCCWVRWMDDEERIHRGAVCPFLATDGRCAIHPVRPLACRGVASLDRAACERAFAPTLFEENRLVPADLLRRAVFDAAFMGLTQALTQCGLNARSIELGTGVRAFLRDPQLAATFLSGNTLSALWDI